MTGLSLPLRATMTGGRTPERYCPACLDRWQYGVPEVQRTPIHPACRDALPAGVYVRDEWGGRRVPERRTV